LSAQQGCCRVSYRRARVPGGAYFSTVVTERHQPVLIHADLRVRETLLFRMMAEFLLPDHLHAI